MPICKKHLVYEDGAKCPVLTPSPFDENKWGCPFCGWPLDRRDDMGDGGVTCACGAWVPLPDGDPEPVTEFPEDMAIIDADQFFEYCEVHDFHYIIERGCPLCVLEAQGLTVTKIGGYPPTWRVVLA